MPDSLGDLKRRLRERLTELEPLVEEYRQLERAAAALDAQSPRSEREERPARSAPRRRRAGRGENKRAVLAVVAERPGVTVGELAEVTRIERPLIYGVTRAGIERGELEAVDLGGGRKGFKLADPEAAGREAGRSLDEATAGIDDPDVPAPVGG